MDFDKTRDRLIGKLAIETPHLNAYDEYFEGEQPLEFLSPVLKDELDGRIKEMVVNTPRSAVEVHESRLDIEGFRFSGRESSDDDLWTVYQHNEGDLLSQQGHQESLALGRCYAIVGEGEDADMPLITVESPFQAIHELDQRTKQVSAGLKTWTDPDDVAWASVYFPNGRRTWFQKDGAWRLDGRAGIEDNDFNVCRMVPIVNQQRLLARLRPGAIDKRLGRSIFHDILPLADAVNKMLTDMMVSGEFHAMPRRWAVGLTEDDFTDDSGNPLKTWELIAGRIWASENKDTKMGQFDEADLTVFHNTVKLLMQIVAQLLALPPNYLAFTGDNPASADAIRASESQLVKRIERLQKAFGVAWERVQRLVLLTQGYPDSPDARQIETLWRNPATPTIAQQADATTKLVTTKDGRGRSIVPVEQAREDLGYTSEQRRRMAEYDEAEDPQVTAALRDLRTIGADA